ncbi:hypothetical protein [Xanthomonas sp. WHRI 6106]|uniref:hypothetical protein n=1 Tax=Xanthomonas sp. WHRI 6106 TaxID=3161566 RepID=UPI0032E89490
MEKKQFEDLARRLAARSKELHARDGTKPRLAVVSNDLEQVPNKELDAFERESHRKLIRHIRRRWGFPMQVLIDQACFGISGIERMNDAALVQLHRDLERAQECMREGIAFEDAGLLRSHYG